MIYIIGIITAIAFIVWFLVDSTDRESLFIFTGAVGTLGAIFLIIIIGTLISNECDYMNSSQQIKMYQNENTKIEKDINTIVSSYKNFEQNTYQKVSPTSPITLVTLYPKLKTNTLVNKQIDVYINNNNKIKELKNKRIQSHTILKMILFK